MKLSGFFIFDAKKSIKQNRQCHSVFAWDLRTILTKNERWFPHPSETSCFCEKGQNISCIILHANNSCLNCTWASWKVKTFLSKDNKVGWTPLEFHKKVNPLFIFVILKLCTVNETRVFVLVILENDKNLFFWFTFWWNSRFLSENISPNLMLRIVTCW